MLSCTTKQQILLRRSGLLAAGLATATVASLSAGEAQSITCNFTGGNFTNCALNFAYPSTLPSDKEITFFNAPSVGSGEVRFEWNEIPPPGYTEDVWQVIVDFIPSLAGPAAGDFQYTLKITDPSYSFKDVFLGAFVPLPNVTVRKQVYSDAGFSALLHDVTVNNTGHSGFFAFEEPYQQLWVRDTYTVASGGLLNEINNGYRQVPGPLPLLGAGTAFGFSRKLRRRIGSARQLSKA
jgi:hypothetical protein